MEWRQRDEWVISEKPTHPALITRTQAEKILALYEFKRRAPRVCEPDKFILSGMMFTPEGVQWHGDAHDSAYRAGAKGKRVNAPWLEGAVLFRIVMDFADKKFISRTVAGARRMAESIETDPLAIEGDIKRAEKRLSNLWELAADSGDKSLLAKIRELEAKLTDLREQKAAWAERKALKQSLLSFDEKDLRDILAATALRLRGDGEKAIELLGYPNGPQLKPDELRRVLTALVERIELDPATREFTIRYRIPITGVRVASPRRAAARPAITMIRRLALYGFKRNPRGPERRKA